ncbi:alpha/beta fold hydrolase [Streptosporangium sp. NPDC049304]|uniref:alpha/beta hydrolase n=1 Tax=Streptosporangium sp. NPDC049304 TaxID=3154830 RepID=UPI00341936E5
MLSRKGSPHAERPAVPVGRQRTTPGRPALHPASGQPERFGTLVHDAAGATVHRTFHRLRRQSPARAAIGTTMADLAAVYAQAIRGISEGPVNMLAISTGGSIALQLAADHPGLVDRLVLAGTACTLGPIGRRAQRAYIERSRQGRRPSPALAEVVTESTIGRGCSKPCCGCLTAVTKTTPTPSSSSTPRMVSTCVNGCTASRRSRC